MSNKNKLVEFLDKKLELSVKGLAFAEEIKPNQDNINYWKDEIAMFTEIKGIVEDKYRLEENMFGREEE